MDDKGDVFQIAALVERWCPPQFRNDPPRTRVSRAFLNAIACVDDLRTQLRGQESIRTDYPDPAWPPEP